MQYKYRNHPCRCANTISIISNRILGATNVLGWIGAIIDSITKAKAKDAGKTFENSLQTHVIIPQGEWTPLGGIEETK